MTQNNLSLILLAAGKGTRMKSSLAKVLHPIMNRPMIHHVLKNTESLGLKNRIVVVGHQKEKVMEALRDTNCSFAIQTEQLGTAHAVLAAKDSISDDCQDVLIFYGDMPLVRSSLLEKMYQEYKEQGAMLAFMTTFLDNPTNYGRVQTTKDGAPLRIIEEKDADADEKKIKEINTGIYCVNKNFLYDSLAQVNSNNEQGELYLTDIVELAVKQNQKVVKYVTTEAKDVLGVNSRVELSEAEQELRLRRNKKIMMSGVSLLSPSTIYISENSEVGMDTVIGAGVELRGKCTIGANCTIDKGAILTNCIVADGITIAPYSCKTDVKITEDITTRC